MSRRLFVTTLALLIGTVTPAAMTTAATTPMGVEAVYREYEYYSDSSKTVLVGGDTIMCNGQRYTWGQKTAYYFLTTESCW